MKENVLTLGNKVVHPDPVGRTCLQDSAFFFWGSIIWQIVATEKTTGKRILLATADNETERTMILRQERKEKRYETVKAVRVWN